MSLLARMHAGILTWQEGLVGLPLQQCCAQAPSPHVVMCDTPNGTVMPNECWFIVYKVQQAKSKAKVQEDLRRADVTVRDIDHGSKRRSLLGRWQQPMRKRRTRRRTLSLHGNGVDAGRVPDSMSVSGGVRQRKAGDDHARALVASDATAHALDVGQAESTEHEQLRPDGRVHVVEPITNGDLVMLYNKAFGRYCSVSFDGELLCVSVKPSNATRNLFVLGMQP